MRKLGRLSLSCIFLATFFGCSSNNQITPDNEDKALVEKILASTAKLVVTKKDGKKRVCMATAFEKNMGKYRFLGHCATKCTKGKLIYSTDYKFSKCTEDGEKYEDCVPFYINRYRFLTTAQCVAEANEIEIYLWNKENKKTGLHPATLISAKDITYVDDDIAILNVNLTIDIPIMPLSSEEFSSVKNKK